MFPLFFDRQLFWISYGPVTAESLYHLIDSVPSDQNYYGSNVYDMIDGRMGSWREASEIFALMGMHRDHVLDYHEISITH